jgi:hypothetical protein
MGYNSNPLRRTLRKEGDILMKTLKYLGILIVVLSLSGCIIRSATPDPSIPVSMEIGQLKNFTIVASSLGYKGSIVQSWYVDGINKNWSFVRFPFLALSSGTFEIEGRVDIVQYLKNGDKNIVATESRFWTVTVN